MNLLMISFKIVVSEISAHKKHLISEELALIYVSLCLNLLGQTVQEVTLDS